MDLTKLREAGAFVPAELVKRQVEWNGHVFDVYVKRLSFGVVEDMLAAAGSDTKGRSSKLIASAICLEDGTPAMDFADAYQLRSSLARVLAYAIREVNELGEA